MLRLSFGGRVYGFEGGLCCGIVYSRLKSLLPPIFSLAAPKLLNEFNSFGSRSVLTVLLATDNFPRFPPGVIRMK